MTVKVCKPKASAPHILAGLPDDGSSTSVTVSELSPAIQPRAPLATPLTPFTTDRAYRRTVYFPHFADGDGWATQVILVNPTVRTITGTVETGWNVSYGLLHRAGRESPRNGAERLNGVAGMARRLMDEHGLTGWTLAFGEARTRLGACHFRHHVIWISRTHALEGSEEQIRDTVLHEIVAT